MIYPPEPPHPLVGHWLKRHVTLVSFVLHMIGIPIMMAGLAAMLLTGDKAMIPIVSVGSVMVVAGGSRGKRAIRNKSHKFELKATNLSYFLFENVGYSLIFLFLSCFHRGHTIK